MKFEERAGKIGEKIGYGVGYSILFIVLKTKEYTLKVFEKIKESSLK